ncbi:hypothetical protein FRUB_05692 [Fimbriiglobus ruber]|uniref:Uncharacterized protein n=2 Tax=Fimbriiglobus ruber TaxID=1908690 RepID=A0A225DEB2_9BACT|nr:hypothetical protein FRUB_05692 [Fimbriiglobus ruber]
MIREAIGLYLAGVRDRCSAEGLWANSEPDTPSDESDVHSVTLLLPVSRLAELDAHAASRDTTAGVLIRRLVCSSLLKRSAGERPPNES